MKWRKFVILSIILPLIVGLLLCSPFIYNWHRNKSLVEQRIDAYEIVGVPSEIVKATHSLMRTLVDVEFIPVIYQAFGFGYCITLLCLSLYYLLERKDKNVLKFG